MIINYCKMVWLTISKGRPHVSFNLILVTAHLFIFNQIVNAQNPAIVPFDSLHWHIEGKDVKEEDFQEKKCLSITDGAAYLKDSFKNGIIEFDISFDKDRSFPGLMFRIADAKNFEFIYLRPHKSGNPDAIQYCPVYYGDDSWQLYTGEGYCAQRDFVMNSWMHVKVVISEKKAELYLNNEMSPVLFIGQLQRDPAGGGLALDNHSPTIVRFANFQYSKLDNPLIKSVAKTRQPLATGIVKKWQVSNAFNETVLANTMRLHNADLKSLKWRTIGAEDPGFINIGKYVAMTTDENAVFAKFTLTSNKAQIRKMALGFSDRCKVYLDGKLLYAGSNTFRSRDYRFYGTIGFWDDVFLDLKKGTHEVTIAVSESFGGWAVEAKFDDLKDLIISK